jgi:putative hydrolase of the HAD superfamily
MSPVAKNAVLFDLDGTLLDRESSIHEFAVSQHDRLPALHHIPRALYVSRFEALDSHGSVWKDVVYQTLVAELGIVTLDWRDLLQDYESAFRHSCVPYPNLHRTLGVLKRDGLLLGIISNGRDAFQRTVIDALELNEYLAVILISESQSVRKPDIEIFNRALKRLDVPAAQSLFVGDNPEADIRGAKNAGMKAVWKRNTIYSPPAVYDGAIGDLSELIDLVPAILC